MGYMVCRRNVANYSVGMHAEHSNFSLSLLPPLSLHLRLSFESHKMVTRCIVKQVLNNLQMLVTWSPTPLQSWVTSYIHIRAFQLFSLPLSLKLGVKEEQEAVVRRELQKRELILKDKVSLFLQCVYTMYAMCKGMNSSLGEM